MAKPEWGTKCTCQECGAKFYDLRRPEVACPKCGAEYQTVSPKPKRSQPQPKKPRDQKPSAAPAGATGDAPASKIAAKGGDAGDAGNIDADVEEADIEEDDEDVIEDTSDLGDDDDDVAEVVQKPGATEET